MYNTQNSFMYPYQQQQQQQTYQAPGYAVRPVTSREEAVAAQIDFMGPGTVMPDLGHGVIYLKKFNSQTGSSDLLEFRYAEPAPPRDELGELKNVVAQLQKDVEALKGGAVSE